MRSAVDIMARAQEITRNNKDFYPMGWSWLARFYVSGTQAHHEAGTLGSAYGSGPGRDQQMIDVLEKRAYEWVTADPAGRSRWSWIGDLRPGAIPRTDPVIGDLRPGAIPRTDPVLTLVAGGDAPAVKPTPAIPSGPPREGLPAPPAAILARPPSNAQMDPNALCEAFVGMVDLDDL